MKNITPFLWFDTQAEEAANFYVSLFKNARISDEAGDAEAGNAMSVVSFELEGQVFNAVNGGPEFKYTDGVSFVVNCETQEEVDHYWENLSEGGSKGQCGWLKDRYGVSWQIVPMAMSDLMSTDTVKAKAVIAAMLTMTKLDINQLQEAYDAA